MTQHAKRHVVYMSFDVSACKDGQRRQRFLTDEDVVDNLPPAEQLVREPCTAESNSLISFVVDISVNGIEFT